MISHTSTSRFATFFEPVRSLRLAMVVTCITLLSATAAADDKGADDETIDQKIDSYWSVDRDLPAVKKRIFERDDRFGLGVYLGLASSEPFYYYYPVGLRASYYFSNNLGVELEGSFMDAPGVLSHDTELTNFLSSSRGEGFNKATDTQDRYLWRTNALVSWHPLYGKLAFLQRKLAHFDFSLSLGGGVVSVERPGEFRQEVTSKIAPELAVGAGLEFFATRDVVVRLEGRAYAYRGAKTPSTSGFFSRLELPTEFLLGASYMF